MEGLHSVVPVPDQNHCIVREGFVFTSITAPANVLDAIVVRVPEDCGCHAPKLSRSSRSLSEHIAFINAHRLEKAFVIGQNLDFLAGCPSLKYLRIVPTDSAPTGLDYSPLYDLPGILSLSCQTASHGTAIDYSGFSALRELYVDGPGHRNFAELPQLKELYISSDKAQKDMTSFRCKTKLQRLWYTGCGIQTLEGLENCPELQQLCLSHCRSLRSIEALAHCAPSLRALSIENCSKLQDFSVLSRLTNLEFLTLHGRNSLPDVSFLKDMKKLKVFVTSMEIQNGDLMPCLAIPYADVTPCKAFYNLRNKDLPKQLPKRPFVLKDD